MRTITRFFIVLGFILISADLYTFGQVAISIDDSNADSSAMLDVKSTNKGVLIPRMTHTQLSAITSPANGLMVFCTDCGTSGTGALAIFTDGKWNTFNASCLVPSSPASGAHLPVGTQITWNWNAVQFATGYKWGTSNVYADAEDLGVLDYKDRNRAYMQYSIHQICVGIQFVWRIWFDNISSDNRSSRKRQLQERMYHHNFRSYGIGAVSLVRLDTGGT